MTFYYDADADELVGNNAGAFAEFRDGPNPGTDSLHIDVTEIMEDGRGRAKLREIRDAAQQAIHAHEEA